MSQELSLAIDRSGPDDFITVLVVLDVPVTDELSDKNQPLQLPVPAQIQYYRRMAATTQANLLRELRDEGAEDIEVIDQSWLVNAILMKAKPRKIRKIAKRKDVHKVSRNGQVRLVDPTLQPVTFTSEPGIAWGADAIDVASCWNAGYDGDGVIVAHTDTGVDPSHPALAGKFTGEWFDAVKGRPDPYDDNGHGTHTLGTLLGGDGSGPYPDDIGVAPGARYVGVKVMNHRGVGTYQQCLAGLEYIAELKAQLDIRVICGSWSLADPKEEFLFKACLRLRELGILTVFAAGNAGPDLMTADTPSNYPSVTCVGAVDRDGHVADFSARGNAPQILPWSDPTTWSLSDWNFRKPDLTAPGVEVRSCVPGGGFQRLSGTSMAAPHVAGVAALLLEKNPDLTPQDLLLAMVDSARPGNGGSPNKYDAAYGWGCVDAWQALNLIDHSVTKAPSAYTPDPDLGLLLSAASGADGNLLRFHLPRDASVGLRIYNVAGQCVRTLASGATYAAGPQSLIWDGRDDRGRQATSGVYFARVTASGQAAACKFVLVR